MNDTKANILLVDDHPENLLALETVLADLGQNLVKADSSMAALRCVLKQDFAVILLDVQMPEMDGFEAAALIRERERSKHTPIIFLTAIGKSDPDVFKGYSVGAVDYLFKPFTPEILKSKVSVFVELFKMREQVRVQAEQLADANHKLGQEVAERTRIESEIRRSEIFLDSIIENLPNMVFVKDAKSLRFLRFNKAGEALLGISRADLMGKSDYDLFPPEQADQFTVMDREVLGSGGLLDIPAEPIETRNGRRILHTKKIPIADDRGEPLYLLGISEDITARHRVEEERGRFFTLSLDMLCVAGFDGYFKELSPLWEKTFGFTKEELLARPYLDFIHPEDRERTMAEASSIAAGQLTVAFENRYRCRDGSYKWLLWNACPVVEEQVIYAAARDITDHKRHVEDMRELNREIERRARDLEGANKELEAFSYSVSHDLRAPLRHIDGFAELLQKQGAAHLDEKGRRYLTMISDSAKQMGRLIDDLLAFSRVGRAELRQTTVNLDQLVKDVLHDLQPDIEGRHIAWTVHALPQVQGDQSLLRQVWANLISNALKYSGTRELAAIEIGCLEDEPHEFVFFVRDNGVGFDMQYANKLFGVFQRLHSASEFEGTGIGLANVRRIIARHGGRTWAQGRPDEGATFFVSLPRRSAT